MTRAERLRRLARAQRALADVAMAEQVAAQVQYHESQAQAGEILEALNGESALHGVAVAAMATAIRRNGRATERLRRFAEAKAEAHVRQDRAADLLEQRTAEAEAQDRSAGERLRLELMVSSLRRR